MSWYKTGTVTLTESSGTVTGTGTAWLSAVKSGDTLIKDDALFEITAVASNTSLTISPAWPNATATDTSYAIIPTSETWNADAEASFTAYVDALPQLLSGTTNPSNSVGTNGSLYFNLNTDTLFSKSGGVWDSGFSYAGTVSFNVTPSGAGVAITGGSGAGDGSTITVALSNDAGAIEGLSGTGLAVRTATDTWATRSLVAPAEGLTITNPAGVAGNITLALADDLAGLEAISTQGMVARTGTNTYATRTIEGTADEITVTNGNGTSDDPAISLASNLALASKTVTVGDTNFSITDTTDATKVAKFELSGLTTGTTRTLTVPNESGTLALTANVQPVSTVLTDLTSLGSALTAGDLLTAGGADNLTRLGIGAAGAFLRALSGAPGWDATPLFGSIVLRQFTTSGTYTPTTGLVHAIAICVGAGGGGGGVNVGTAAHIALAGGGGASGSLVISALSAATIGTSKYVTIGTAGSGGSGNAAGTTGGSTGIGTALNDFSIMRANGGNGGAQASRTTTGITVGAGGAAVTAATGDLKLYGAAGSQGTASYATTLGQYGASSGIGGGTLFGSGGASVFALSAIVNGAAGQAYGAGGSGAAAARNTTGTGTGGAGAAGYCLIIEFVAG